MFTKLAHVYLWNFQYVSALETTPMRREKLKAGWYFDCKCGRCTDPTENESFVSATR